MNIPIPSIIKGAKELLSPLRDIADEFHLSGEEKALLEMRIREAEDALTVQIMEQQNKVAELQASIVKVEAQGEGFWQRNWRPFTMLTFVAVVVLHWFGVAGENISPEIQEMLYGFISTGLTGYVFLRTAEKRGGEWISAWKGQQGDKAPQQEVPKDDFS